MSEGPTYAQAHYLAEIQARAAIAAALLHSNTIKLTTVELITGDPRKDTPFTTLKSAVDKVMIAIGASLT